MGEYLVKKQRWLKTLWVLGAVVALGCGARPNPDPDPDPDPNPDPQPEVIAPVQQEVGVTGATLALSNGASLTIPAEALDANVELSMAVAETEAPAELKAASPVFEFGPAGTVFARPVKVRFPVTGTVTSPTVYWSKADGEGYEAIGGTLVDGWMEAEVLHFSSGFVGEGSGTRTVTGVEVVTWVTENGIKNVPNDLTAREFAAYVENADGTFTEIPAVGRADGTFTIEGVPSGTYYVRSGSSYYVTDESILDLGASRLGRPDTTIPTSETILNVQASNLAAWQAGDRLQLFSTNSNSWYFEFQDYMNPAPTVGDTTLDAYLYTNLWQTNLIEGTKGDVATLAQLGSYTSENGVPYTAINRVLTFDPFTQVAGGEMVTVSGAMQPVASDHEISLDFKLTQFEALGSQAVPSVGATYSALAVMGHPGGTERGFYSNAADFLIVSPAAGADVATGKMSYGAPLSGTWGQSVLARVQFRYEYQLEGSTSPRYEWANLETTVPVAAAKAGPLVPGISPVRNVKVNGAPADALVTGVSPRPVVSWEAPELGEADLYTVNVLRLYDDGTGATKREAIAWIDTPDTQVRIPDGLMDAGGQYALRIIAIADGVKTTARPNRTTLPASASTTLTAVIQMAP